MDDIYHVIPLNDLRPHDESADCWCKPVRIEEDAGGTIFAHASMDRREHTIEKGIVH